MEFDRNNERTESIVGERSDYSSRSRKYKAVACRLRAER